MDAYYFSLITSIVLTLSVLCKSKETGICEFGHLEDSNHSLAKIWKD